MPTCHPPHALPLLQLKRLGFCLLDSQDEEVIERGWWEAQEGAGRSSKGDGRKCQKVQCVVQGGAGAGGELGEAGGEQHHAQLGDGGDEEEEGKKAGEAGEEEREGEGQLQTLQQLMEIDEEQQEERTQTVGKARLKGGEGVRDSAALGHTRRPGVAVSRWLAAGCMLHRCMYGCGCLQ